MTITEFPGRLAVLNDQTILHGSRTSNKLSLLSGLMRRFMHIPDSHFEHGQNVILKGNIFKKFNILIMTVDFLNSYSPYDLFFHCKNAENTS